MTSLLFCYCTPADINFIILVDPGILYYNVYSGIRELSPTLTEIAIRKRSSSNRTFETHLWKFEKLLETNYNKDHTF